MSLRRLHRRLAVFMGLAGLLAFAGGAGFEPLSTLLAGTALVTALFWHPSSELSARLEHIWVPLAGLLVLRALFHVVMVGGDVVIPVVDLLLLLLSAESLRSLDAPNDARLYALSFALLLASAAYRPGILFAVAFLVYVVAGTLAMFVGHLRREAEQNGTDELSVGRRLLFGVAGLSGVTLLVAAGVFLTFPRVSSGWSGRGETPASSVAGFSDEVSLGEFGAQIYGNPRIVLRVEFPERAPEATGSLHWRGRSYDRFDGIRWSRSSRLPPALAPDAWYEERWGEERLVQEIYATALDTRVLFALHPVVDVEARSQIQPLFDNTGDFTYWGSGNPAYQAVSLTGRPSADELRNAEGRFTPARGHYTQLPELDERIASLADSLTAGRSTRYDRAVAIRDWLQSSFTYTTELPDSPEEATLEHFLFQRRAGHCEYFSTAMAILLRTQGVPTRNVNGFLGGQWSDFGQYLAVTQNEAHSWVEVWFPDYGWVPFDPTPAGGGGAEAEAVWFWPGRILLDGIQHRWGKWVLDYSVDTQWGLLERARSLMPDPAGGGTGAAGDEQGGRRLLWLGIALVSLLAGGAVALRMRRAHPPATRTYLRLRRDVGRAGFHRTEGLPPLTLVERLRHASHPAAEPASEVVGIYLRVRFGGEELTDVLRSRLARSLARARACLRSGPGTDEGGNGGPDRA